MNELELELKKLQLKLEEKPELSKRAKIIETRGSKKYTIKRVNRINNRKNDCKSS